MLDNIPIFRAKKIDSEDYVEGFLTRSRCYSGVYILPSNYTQDEDIEGYEEEIVEIDPTTIAIHFPDMLDNQNKKIFASLRLDGKGGDIVEEYVGDEVYNGTVFIQNGCMELRTDYDGKAKPLIDFTYINESIGCEGVKIIGIQQ